MRAVNTINSVKKNAATAIMSGLGHRQAQKISANARREQSASDLMQAVINDDVAAAEKALWTFKKAGGDLDQLRFNCEAGGSQVTLNIIELTHFHESKKVFTILWAALSIWNREMAEDYIDSLRMAVNLVPMDEPLPRFKEEILMLLGCPDDLETAKSRVMDLSGRELNERFYIEWLRIARYAMARYEKKELESMAEPAGSSKRGKARL